MRWQFPNETGVLGQRGVRSTISGCHCLLFSNKEHLWNCSLHRAYANLLDVILVLGFVLPKSPQIWCWCCFTFISIINYYHYLCVCMCVCVCKLEDNLWDSVVYRVDPKDWTQAIKFGSRHYQLYWSLSSIDFLTVLIFETGSHIVLVMNTGFR